MGLGVWGSEGFCAVLLGLYVQGLRVLGFMA